MKRVKPGRGPSGMSFIGSIFVVVFGVFWTVIAATISAGVPIIGVIFPLFGVMFVIMGVVQAIYHYKNATGKDRYSIIDIVDSSEEGDPSDDWVKGGSGHGQESNGTRSSSSGYCPYCGSKLDSDYVFCPKCGKQVRK